MKDEHNIYLIDTHCHMQSAGSVVLKSQTKDLWSKAKELNGDLIIKRAINNGVRKMICVGCDLTDSQAAIQFAVSHPECWASIGIHPHQANEYRGKNLLKKEFSNLAMTPRVIAIGECGLDYFYNYSDKAAQYELLEFQIDLAIRCKLPLIFHVRQAFDDFWPIFDNFASNNKIRGVLHSFTDNDTNLKKAIARGLFIGVNGIVTFVKKPEQLEIYRSIPLNNLLLETDAPYLTPSPYRGTINESKYIKLIAEFLADLRGCREGLADLSIATTNNANKLFNLSSKDLSS